jgi:hypothetical protein
MKDNSEARAKEGFSIENCAASESERKRWGDCFKELTEKVAPLNNLSNPFTSVLVHFVAKSVSVGSVPAPWWDVRPGARGR